MHDTAVAGGDVTLADGLTYLFDRKTCAVDHQGICSHVTSMAPVVRFIFW